jgi:hypothetical protein
VGILTLPASLIFGWLWEAMSPGAAFLCGAALALAGLAVLWLETSFGMLHEK